MILFVKRTIQKLGNRYLCIDSRTKYPVLADAKPLALVKEYFSRYGAHNLSGGLTGSGGNR